jgi:AcrR family transcriptional regulator
LELYLENGFEQTTVAEIAARAGLTERTFFRYFADKREVLFQGATQFQELIVGAVADAPTAAAPIDTLRAALEAAAAQLQTYRPHSLRRQAVINATPSLQERELIKMASLAVALGAALRDRGVAEPAASLTAEAGVAAFRVAFARWATPDNERQLTDLVGASFDELRAVTAGA